MAGVTSRPQPLSATGAPPASPLPRPPAPAHAPAQPPPSDAGPAATTSAVPAHPLFRARPRPVGAGSPPQQRIVAKAGSVALVCSAMALAAVVALSGFDREGGRTPSSSATAVVGAGPGGANGNTSNGNSATVTASSTVETGRGATGVTPATPAPGSTSTRSGGGTASTVDGTGPETTSPSAGTQPVNPSTTGLANQTALQTSLCTDTSGDQSAEGVGDIDLTEVTLGRNSTGLTVRFGLAAPINTPAAAATPTMSSWQILMAQGDDVVYAFTVSNVEGAWETSLVDFASPEGDRFGAMAPASGQAIEVFLPNADLARLPDQFTWWATSLTDRLVSQGLFANDDCPSGSGVTEAGLALPPESRRASFG